MRSFLAIFALIVGALPALAQADFDTAAEFAMLMDYKSGTVLFQKQADASLEPASMAKLMTLAVVFSEIVAGRLSMDDVFVVSEHAWRAGGASSGGSTMFAELGSEIRVEDLVRSVIIQSGNDAAIVLAEGIAGSERGFAAMMNDLAKQIGLEGSHFTNATGLPDPEMVSTARDLAMLGRYLIGSFPQYYHYFSEPKMTWNNITQPNRNALLDRGIGVDGLKTGHTEAAGYGSVLSAADSERRLIAVVHGLESTRERTEEGHKLLNWGARNFERVAAYPEGKVVAHADVYGGASEQVGLVGQGEIALYLPRGTRQCLSGTVHYLGPLLPPVTQGEHLAELKFYCDAQLIQSVPLYASETVKQGNLVRRATDALKHLALSWL